MMLSPHFELEEFTHSERAVALGLDNSPPAEILQKLRYAANMLEVVRSDVLQDKPIVISSGYRCLALNRAVGSKDTSHHVRGLAVDFTCPKFGTPLQACHAIAASDIDFQQLIYECVRGGKWVHLAFPDPIAEGKREILTIDAQGTRKGLPV